MLDQTACEDINLQAVRIMGNLCDVLEAGGYAGHELKQILVRVLFCLFAEDTGIFARNAFQLFLENHTHEDGSNLGPQLAQFFRTLDTPLDQRQANLCEGLAKLPYVNGELFTEHLTFAPFNRAMRRQLLDCTQFDWSRISPAVFGALFQAVMEPKERRQVGAHYTSERDILKVIGPLFLDELKAALKTAKMDRCKLFALHERLANIRLFDPACGCGNFLVVAYRELRGLEMEILQRLNGTLQKVLDIRKLSRIDVDQMYGIEIEEWPARIAEVAIWLMDHQMNLQLSQQFGHYFVRLPLKKRPHIRLGNALRIDWNEVLPASQCSYVLGNPPFIGKQFRTTDQVADMKAIWGNVRGSKTLDYVTCWYREAFTYIRDTNIGVAFVSTNSISQGEQVAVFWNALRQAGPVAIHFAHRTFTWMNEASGKAHVHVVIIGFGCELRSRPRLFDYERGSDEPIETIATQLNAYLVDGPSVLIESRNEPLCSVPPIVFGSMPNDGGHLLLDAAERTELLRECPAAAPFVRKFLGAEEFLNRIDRWCLWLVDADPKLIRTLAPIRRRVEAVKSHRASSQRATTKGLATTPTLFGEIRQPKGKYLLIPRVSSERRHFIPIGYHPATVIASDATFVLSHAKLLHFGVLSSTMHMAWVRYVAGRLKSDFRYSSKLVYNNFPWPTEVSDAKRKKIEAAAQQVLAVRDEFPASSLADLYDPLAMPAKLSKAHAVLDEAVDSTYRSQSFADEQQRIAFLFQRYQQLAKPLNAAPSSAKKRSVRKQEVRDEL